MPEHEIEKNLCYTWAPLGLLLGSITLSGLTMLALSAMISPTMVAAEAKQAAGEPPLIADFEAGLPAGWFQYGAADRGRAWSNCPATLEPDSQSSDPVGPGSRSRAHPEHLANSYCWRNPSIP
ncbi:MAG: hypothetical protein PVI07_01840 [Anaerolineae bacterium]